MIAAGLWGHLVAVDYLRHARSFRALAPFESRLAHIAVVHQRDRGLSRPRGRERSRMAGPAE
jgi:hypothetical protein